jgi:hypothetical protein
VILASGLMFHRGICGQSNAADGIDSSANQIIDFERHLGCDARHTISVRDCGVFDDVGSGAKSEGQA